MGEENEGGGGEGGRWEVENEGVVRRETAGDLPLNPIELHESAEATNTTTSMQATHLNISQATSSDVKFGDLGVQSSLLKFGFQAITNVTRKAFGLKKSRKRKKDVKSYVQLDLSVNKLSRKEERVIVKGRRQL